MLILVGAGVIVFEAVAAPRRRAARSRTSASASRDRVLGGRSTSWCPPTCTGRRARTTRRRWRATPRTCAPTPSTSRRGARRAGADRGHRARGARRDRGADRRLRDRLHGRPDPQPLVARAGGRGAAAGGARHRAEGDRRPSGAGAGGLPQAARAARRAAPATSTCTCSSRPGTSLERAHEVAHELQDAIRARIPRADVLVHIEPSTRRAGPRGGRSGKQVDRGGQADEQRAPRCSRRIRSRAAAATRSRRSR